MASPHKTWPDARREVVERVLRESATRAEAADRLGVTLSSLGHACARYRIEPKRILHTRPVEETSPASAGRSVFGVVPQPVEHAETRNAAPTTGTDTPPAWQGYRPRPGFSVPTPMRAAPRQEPTIVSVVMADIHKPYEHKRDLACAKSIVREIQPNRVILNGDIMEMESLSRHPKSKPDLTRLSEEYYETNVELDDIQDCAANAESIYFEGNHCGRAARFACEFGTLDGMLSVPQSLYIEPRGDYHRETSQLRGMRWIPLKDQPLVMGNIAVLHGVYEAKHHAAANAESLGPRAGVPVVISAHMHGFQAAESAAGFRSYACPWLGDETQAVFRSYVKGKPKPWSRGLLVIEEAGPSVAVTHVRIEHGRATFGGQVYAAAA